MYSSFTSYERLTITEFFLKKWNLQLITDSTFDQFQVRNVSKYKKTKTSFEQFGTDVNQNCVITAGTLAEQTGKAAKLRLQTLFFFSLFI